MVLVCVQHTMDGTMFAYCVLPYNVGVPVPLWRVNIDWLVTLYR